MIKIKLKKILNNQSGFSVLFASLIGSLVLAIGLAILSITLKQIVLSSAGRESQKAFYAADTGTECALYLDKGGGNGACNNASIFRIPGKLPVPDCDPDTASFTYKCSGVELNGADAEPNTITYDDTLPSESDGGIIYERIQTTVRVRNTGALGEPICFDIYVIKKSNDNGETVKTDLESRGYSTCSEEASNRFERAILTTY